MPEYKAPLRDISFVMNELLKAEAFYKKLPGFEDATQERGRRQDTRRFPRSVQAVCRERLARALCRSRIRRTGNA